MKNKEVIKFLLEDLSVMCSDDEKVRRPYYEQAIRALKIDCEACVYKDYFDDNVDDIITYCKESLSKCDEFREKYLKSNREYDRSQAKLFEGMAEAYSDIIKRFVKEGDTNA
ncbi:MAG: hypothetical protein J6R30_09490 [Bacteroidales bacterium]|nr:hypothetical protein [Bacteroidales bacterium]